MIELHAFANAGRQLILHVEMGGVYDGCKVHCTIENSDNIFGHANCTKLVVQTNLPNIGMTYIF